MNKQNIIDGIKAALSDDIEVKLTKVNKNGIEVEGIQIKNSTNVAQVYYPEDGFTDDVIAMRIVDAYNENLENAEKYSHLDEMLKDFNTCKDKIYAQLYNATRSLNDNVITLEFTDRVGIIFYLKIDDGATIKITDYFINLWGIDTNDLLEIAKENMNKDVIFAGMIRVLTGGAFERYVDSTPLAEQMYVMTNVNKFKGSGYLLLLNDLIKSGEITKSNFIIIPSSVHEIILIPDNDYIANKEMINMMINDVNSDSSLMCPEEVLSDRAMFYDYATGKFTTM